MAKWPGWAARQSALRRWQGPKSGSPNCTWQQLSVLAHNVIQSFQLDTLPAPTPRSRKRTYSYLLRSMRALRFLVIARAGRVARIGDRNVLRLGKNPATQLLYPTDRSCPGYVSYLRIWAS